jgi:hypothetical protein
VALLRLEQGGFITAPEGFDFWRTVSQGEYSQQIPWRSIIDLVRSGKLGFETYIMHHYMKRLNRYYQEETQTKHK